MILDSGYIAEATGEKIYRIRFGTSVKSVAESEIEYLPDITDAWDAIRRSSFNGSRAFKTLMTFERLRRPPSPIAASFGSAKAAFYPFQFKPLLKFLDNPTRRLLIADDVGLGKTIEAGYILRELKSRFSIERILLVVPSRLSSKWKSEMERRFNEHFEIVKKSQLISLRESMEKIGELDSFSWIVSIESARDRSVIDFLEEAQLLWI